MRQLLILSLSLGLAATPAGAASPTISFGQAVQAVFQAASKVKLKLTGQEAPKPKTVKAAGGSRWERVSGYVRLSGTHHVSPGATNAYIEVSAYEDITGEMGRITSGRIRLSSRDFYRLNGNFISGYARISEYVSFYKNGRYIGQTRVSGSIYVTGRNSNGWVRLSGSGRVTGDLYFEDERP